MNFSQDQLGSIRQSTNLHISLVFAADKLMKNKDKMNKRKQSSRGLFHMDQFVNSLKSAVEKGDCITFTSEGMKVHGQNRALLLCMQ